MSLLLALGVPASVLVLFVLWAIDQRRHRANGSVRRLSTVYTDEMTALFYGTKRMELDHRESMSMMREEQAQGAPPRTTVDLERGTVTFRSGQSRGR